jgi:segregation and condensation protein A
MPEEAAVDTRDIFSFKTEVFEGPLSLLIELIEKRKLLINDISLAAVTDEYMRRVAEMERSPLRETAEFIVLASTLLLIKSKSLLPILSLTEEEEESIENLEERLRRYQIFRDAGVKLANIFGKRMLFEREFVPSQDPIFTPDSFTELSALKGAMQDVIQALPKKQAKPKVQVRKTVSLEDMMIRLRERIEKQMKLKFNDFTGGAEKSTIIVGFLAVLEMVKQGIVMVKQTDRFDDIEIEREGVETPRYM